MTITVKIATSVPQVRSVMNLLGALSGARFLRQMALLLMALSLVPLGGCAWLDTKQRSIIYRPTPGIPADFTGLRTGDERYFLSVPPLHASKLQAAVAQSEDTPQKIEIWWLPHADPQAPTLLYYHGTFRNLYQNLHKIDALRSAGFAVLAVEYRGWGVSTPITPSESSIMQDADLAWAEFARREPRASHRVIYGHSMGSGVAVDVASRLTAKTDYSALILESALTSFRDVATEAGVMGRILAFFNNERFASIEKISRIQAPLLMIHGSLDTTVPIRVGEKLFAAAHAPKEWLTIQGAAHSNVHQVEAAQYQAALQNFKNKYILAK
jgi:alpha-beta hydrolase superfamily lysophospholipase